MQLLMNDVTSQNDILVKESFYGIKKILDLSEEVGPILIIIKNIKTFPSLVLNDLIHMLKKYRENPMAMKLNLMLGV